MILAFVEVYRSSMVLCGFAEVKTAIAASMTFRLPKVSFALAKSISFAKLAWPIS